MKTETWEIKKDSSIPYISKITILNGTKDEIFCRFIWVRWHNFDRYEMVKRGLLVCGIPVENCREFVEKQYSVIQWLVLPTKVCDLPTEIPHEPGIEIL